MPVSGLGNLSLPKDVSLAKDEDGSAWSTVVLAHGQGLVEGLAMGSDHRRGELKVDQRVRAYD